jgi:hypothetical protein
MVRFVSSQVPVALAHAPFTQAPFKCEQSSGVPLHLPLWQVSSLVHLSLSSHWVPSGSGDRTHFPLWQPAVAQLSPGVQVSHGSPPAPQLAVDWPERSTQASGPSQQPWHRPPAMQRHAPSLQLRDPEQGAAGPQRHWPLTHRSAVGGQGASQAPQCLTSSVSLAQMAPHWV